MTNAVHSALQHASRLAALRATGAMDAPPNEILDRLTRLASRLMGVPITLVSLVDADRQFFASQVGLTEPWATERGTALSHSFCQYVVASRGPLIVEDARINPLVADNLAIPDIGVIAYAGMPLTTSDGEVLGSFCAIDTVPRQWRQDQIAILEDLAHAASGELQLRAASIALAQRESFLTDLLDHTSELVCVTGQSGHIIYANAAMLHTSGYSADELMGKRAVDVVAEDCRQDFIAVAQRARAGEEVSDIETIVVTRDGQRLYCRGRGTPVLDAEGGIAGIRVMFRDLTRERQIQRVKDELIALVSHELRAPVGAIRGALKLLTPHMVHLQGKQRQLFDMAGRNADRLLVLASDLLDIERLESGVMTLARRPVSALSLLEQSSEAMQSLADGAGITLVVKTAAADVDADPPRLQQVLVNLIGNALKFSPAGSTITLSAEPVTLDDARQMVSFCVADQGRGIPPEKLGRVFERFEQVMPSDASEKGGVGLGLAISKAIVEQHGGAIRVESTVGEGCRFYFTVPVAA